MSNVDVVIPCYNYARFLRQCVQSVLTQEGVNVRVLIIDDCSSDESAKIGVQLAAEDSRVKFWRHEVNVGHISTYNEGLLGWATADYCLLLSADDLLIPQALKRATALMDAHPDVGMAYGRAIHTYDPTAETCNEGEGPGTKVLTGPQFIRVSCEEATNLVPTPTAIIRTSVQKRVGGYRHSLPHSGDMEMWLRIAANANIGVIDAELAYYRLHAKNMSVAYNAIRDLRAKKAAFDSAFKEHQTRIPDVTKLQRLAQERLADLAFAHAVGLFQSWHLDAVQEHLDLAVEFDPRIKRRRKWATFAIKRVMGPALAARMQAIVRPGNAGSTPKDVLRSPWIRGRAQPVSG